MHVLTLAMLQIQLCESSMGLRFRRKTISTFLSLKQLWMVWQERPIQVHSLWISFRFVGVVLYTPHHETDYLRSEISPVRPKVVGSHMYLPIDI